MDKIRVYPGFYFTVTMTSMGLFGLVFIVPNLMDANMLLVALNVFMILSFAKVLGFVELTPGHLVYVRIYGRSEFVVEDIADLGMGFVRSRGMKWWFPVLRLATGEEIELRAIRSTSRRVVKKKCSTMAQALKFVDPGLAAIAKIDIGPPEAFTPLPGLEEHWS